MNLTSQFIKLQHTDWIPIDQTKQIISDSEAMHYNSANNRCILLLALSDGIKLFVDNVATELRQGSCILLLPVHKCEVMAKQLAAKLVRFTFETFEVNGVSLRPVDHPPVLCGLPYQLLLSQLKQILPIEIEGKVECYSSLSISEKAMLQSKLQLLLAMMAQLDEQAMQTEEEQKIKWIQYTIDYMEQHYAENVTVEQLANMAQMVRWQYSQRFKTLTGMKPTDYLLQLRMKHAIELLSQSTESLSSIARQIGFKDEYYFSRCFRKMMGNSPREYANTFFLSEQRTITDSLGRKIHLPKDASRVVSAGTNALGELLVLGVAPIGATIALMKKQVIYRNRLRHIHNIGYCAEPDRIAELKPELLLLGNYRTADLPKLDAIAPAIVLDNHFNLFERLRYFAQLFDRNIAAEQWITKYENKVRLVRKRLEHIYDAGETATVYLKLGSKLYIMGQSGLAATLYESFGFRPTSKVRQLIEQKKEWIQIEAQQISSYMGDRNFILRSLEVEDRTVHCPVLTAITKLAAGKVYEMDATWNYEDPITREQLLDILPYVMKR